jgi:hypothetical protein
MGTVALPGDSIVAAMIDPVIVVAKTTEIYIPVPQSDQVSRQTVKILQDK